MSVTNKLWERVIRLRNHLAYYWERFVFGLKIDSPPIFIVGCGHSGTSILLAILDSHPRIHAIPYESSCAIKTNVQKFKAAIKKFDRLAIAARKRRWAEKTPKHILHIDKILEWQPDAKIILILRDGRDVAYSIKKRTGSLEQGIRRWREENLAGKKHWGNPNVHVMKYENLIVDFDTTVTGILHFLGESYDSEMINYHKVEKKWYSRSLAKPETGFGKHQHVQLRNWQINQPLFDGRASYKDLSVDELDYIKSQAGALLVELGYSSLDDEPPHELA